MLMKLYLVRHGDAVSESIDPQRPLSEEGVDEVQRVAWHLKMKNIQLNSVFHSPKRRAQQTAEIMRDTLSPSCALVVKKNLLPEDPVDAIEQELNACPLDLMIVGHMPFLGHLVSVLLKGAHRDIVFKTGTVTLLERGQDKKWKWVWSVHQGDV